MRFIISIFCIALIFAFPVGSALAHGGEPHDGGDAWGSWNLSPTLLLGFLAGGGLYIRGVRAVWRSSGAGAPVTRRQAGFFLGGLLALAVALISPVDALGEEALSWHMIQHLILTLVAAPLLALGNPLTGYLWAVPKPPLQQAARWWNRRRGLKRALSMVLHPLTIWAVHAGALWIWHAPSFYEAALGDDLVHNLQHISFLITALLFWWTVLPVNSPGHYAGYGPAILLLFTTALQGGLLGALLTFSKMVWYPYYLESHLLTGITPLEDQIIAGLLMWIPPGIIYLAATLALLARLLGSGEKDEESSQVGEQRLEA